MQTVIEQFLLEVPAIEKEMQTLGLNLRYSNSTMVRTFNVDNTYYDIYVEYEYCGKYVLYLVKSVYTTDGLLDFEKSKKCKKEIENFENSDFLIDGVKELLEQSK